MQWKQGRLFSSKLCLRPYQDSTQLKRTSKSPTHPRMLGNYFELYLRFTPSFCWKGVKAYNGNFIKSHIWRVRFYINMSKQREKSFKWIKWYILQTNHGPSLQIYLPPQCPKYPNILEIKLLKSGLSNIILLARE